jgi:PEGA domain
MKIYSLLFLPLLFFTSCATITRGVHDKLTVTSDPSGANVILSTGERGVTPTKFVKERKTEPFTVTLSKPGYVSQTVKVESKFGGTGGGAMAGNLLLGGAIGMGVDAGTGAYRSLYPNPVSVHLVPMSTSKSRTTSKRSTTAVSEEKPRVKSKSTKTQTKVETAPKIETAPKSESVPPPAATATPYVPPTLETSPSP